jgi:vancomycin resistance protein YoaR
MKRIVILGSLSFAGFFGFLAQAHAAYAPLTLRHQHHLFTLDPDQFASWRGQEEVWTMQGKEIQPQAEWRVDGDVIPPLPVGVSKSSRVAWNSAAIRNTVETRIGSALFRAAGSVTISRDAAGNIIFDGVGLTGREVDLDALTSLVIVSLERGFTDIVIPTKETQPALTVNDPELQKLGIQEVVTVGESTFAGSPVNRRHNIAVGLSKFNGHLIPKGTRFSFDEVLGVVDGSTGYRKELVIKGDRTEPDFGGGLCQVSTTAYRGVWEYGYPIEQRKNHSYAVSYYGPQGTDATVYPPHPDMKFLNDGPSALLMQTYEDGDHAYFIYYGTKDERKAEVWGPVVLSTTPAPPDRTIYTTALPPGEKKKIGDRHPGVTVLWYRTITSGTGAVKVEPVLSAYEARPLFYEVGASAPMPESLIEGELPEIDINGPVQPRSF